MSESPEILDTPVQLASVLACINRSMGGFSGQITTFRFPALKKRKALRTLGRLGSN